MSTMSKAAQTILHLSLIEGIGSATVEKLCAGYDTHSLAMLADATITDLVYNVSVSEKYAQLIVDGLKNSALYEAELERLEKYSILWVTIEDE